MTMCLLALIENVLYWFLIIPIYVIFFIGLIYTVKTEGKFGRYSLGITTITQIFWLAVLLTMVSYKTKH